MPQKVGNIPGQVIFSPGMSAPPTILKWIRFQLADLTEKLRITRIELFHMVEGENGERLQVFKLKDAEDPNDLATLVWETADGDASSRHHGVSHRYTMLAFRSEIDAPEAQHSFLVHGKGMQHDKSFLDTEVGASNEKGLMGQLMRQNAELHRLVIMDQGRMSAELEAERRRRQNMEEQAHKTFELHQKLMDRAGERELLHAKEISRERRMDELTDMFKTIGPTMIMKVFSQEKLMQSMPQSDSAIRSHLVGQLLTSLTPEEFQGIYNALDGMHQFTFIQLNTNFHQGKLDNATLEVIDQSIKTFLSSLSDKEAEGIFKALRTAESHAAFENLYKSYGRQYQEDQEKRPIPFRKV